MFAEGGVAETNRPPLSCGGIEQEATIAVDKTDSAVGQVLGGFGEDSTVVSTVYLLDLAAGVCTPQPHLLHAHGQFAAGALRLPDGRIICAGGCDFIGTLLSSSEVFEPPTQGALDTAWTWRELPAMSVARVGCRVGMCAERQPLCRAGWRRQQR